MVVLLLLVRRLLSCLFLTHSTRSPHLGLPGLLKYIFTTYHSHTNAQIDPQITDHTVINMLTFVFYRQFVRYLVPVHAL